MPKMALRLLLVLCFAAAANSSKASHIYGADFYYEYVSGYTYKVTLVVYGNCAGSAFPNLSTASPEVQLFNNNVKLSTFSLALQGAGVEVTPVCPASLSNTACNGGTLPGVKRFIYSATISLPSPNYSASWLFRFDGNMGASSQAGRSNNIGNIVFGAGGASITVLEAQLNNTLPTANVAAGHNNSPQFTSIPTPFYCINVQQQYNQGAIDADGDSLAYALVNGLQQTGNNTNPGVTTVTYTNSASGANPLDATSFSFSATNGQLTFYSG